MKKVLVVLFLIFIISGCEILQKEPLPALEVFSYELLEIYQNETTVSEDLVDRDIIFTGIIESVEDRGKYVKAYFYDNVIANFPDIEGVEADITKYDKATISCKLEGVDESLVALGTFISLQECTVTSKVTEPEYIMNIDEFLEIDFNDYPYSIIQVTGELLYTCEMYYNYVILGIDSENYYEFMLEYDYDFNDLVLGETKTIRGVVVPGLINFEFTGDQIID